MSVENFLIFDGIIKLKQLLQRSQRKERLTLTLHRVSLETNQDHIFDI